MAGTCGMMGGRRRSRRRNKKTRKMRGGNGYGFTATPGDVINAGNIAWSPNMTSVPNGQPVVGSVGGARKRRGTKRSGKKTTRRKTAKKDPEVARQEKMLARQKRLLKGIDQEKLAALMKGGGSVANVGYGFAGTGARGIADAIGYPSNLPPSGEFAIPTGTR